MSERTKGQLGSYGAPLLTAVLCFAGYLAKDWVSRGTEDAVLATQVAAMTEANKKRDTRDELLAEAFQKLSIEVGRCQERGLALEGRVGRLEASNRKADAAWAGGGAAN